MWVLTEIVSPTASIMGYSIYISYFQVPDQSKTTNYDPTTMLKPSFEIRELFSLLSQQQVTIDRLRMQVRSKKKTLNNVYNHSAILSKQKELETLQKTLQQVREERKGLELAQTTNEGIGPGVKEGRGKVSQNEMESIRAEHQKLKMEYRDLQTNSRKLDNKITCNHKNISGLSRELKSLFEKTRQVKDSMKRDDWEEYDDEYIMKLEEQYSQLLEKKAMIKESHEKERRDFQKLNKKLKNENRKLDTSIKDKEKMIRFNVLKLRSVKKIKSQNK